MEQHSESVACSARTCRPNTRQYYQLHIYMPMPVVPATFHYHSICLHNVIRDAEEFLKFVKVGCIQSIKNVYLII